MTSPAQSNLLLDFSELSSLLNRELDRAADPLDAFLLAAGMSQVLEDHVHRELFSLAKVIGRLRAVGLGRTAAVAAVVRAFGLRLRSSIPRERALRRHSSMLSALVDELAARVVQARPAVGLPPVNFARAPRALLRAVQRLPNCFVSFDQQPEDCRRLAELFAERRPDRATPVLVLGLRTSGSYLGPLFASYLRAAGYADVRALTHRPGAQLDRRERLELAGRLVLVVDDPPRTGHVLAQTAGELEELGVPAESIVLVVPLLAGAGLPERLAGYDAVTLPWERWDVHRHLAEAPETLSALLGAEVRVLGQPELAPVPRGHVRALFDVDVGGVRQSILAKGVGLGYFGGPASAAAAALAGHVPVVHGIRHGLLWRDWLPEEWRAAPPPYQVAAYALLRREALPVPDDRSLRLGGRHPVWEISAAMLDSCFGKLAPLARSATRRATRRALVAARPSVVDGQMAATNWFTRPGDGAAPLKIGFAAERIFTASGFSSPCYDAFFDVAAAASELPEQRRTLQTAWWAQMGEEVDPERWLLYGLAHQLGAGERARESGELLGILAAERALSRVQQHYASDVFLTGSSSPAAGALCALDLDGVLETRWLGFPAIGPDGALALRALVKHGFRPVLATGRSVDEVRERCRSYPLAGGVAEYGGALYVHEDGKLTVLLSKAERAELALVRRALQRLPGVTVDPGYRCSVRAYRFRADGTRCGLSVEQAESVTRKKGVRAIFGELQTDFQVTGIDKGIALEALASRLDAPVAFAAGDAEPDVPMLRLAEHAFVPAGSDQPARRAGRRMRRRYQAGLLEAIAHFLGHRPGSCSTCAPPPLGRDARLIAACLRAKDAGRAEKLAAALRIHLI